MAFDPLNVPTYDPPQTQAQIQQQQFAEAAQSMQDGAVGFAQELYATYALMRALWTSTNYSQANLAAALDAKAAAGDNCPTSAQFMAMAAVLKAAFNMFVPTASQISDDVPAATITLPS